RTTDSRRYKTACLAHRDIGVGFSGRENPDPAGCVGRHCLGLQPVGRHGDGWAPAFLDTWAVPAAPYAGADGDVAGSAVPGRSADSASVQHGLLRRAATYP